MKNEQRPWANMWKPKRVILLPSKSEHLIFIVKANDLSFDRMALCNSPKRSTSVRFADQPARARISLIVERRLLSIPANFLKANF